MVFFSYFNMVFNMVFNMPNINIFNVPWSFDMVFSMHYSVQHMLKFSTCCFNIVFYTYYSFQHALRFSACFQHTLKYSTQFWCTEILNTQHVLQFQNMLKFWTCFFTVFRTYWNFHHAFLQLSEHAENFNMLFYSFQHSFFDMLSTCITDFNMLWNFQHTFKHENLKYLQSNCNWTHPEIFIKS